MKKQLILTAAMLLMGAVSSWAIPGTLGIDFRDSAWAAANNKHQFTVNGTTATAIVPLVNGKLGYSATDGLGVNSGLLDPDKKEINFWEILDVTFSAPQSVQGAWVTQLFGGRDADSGYVTLTLSDNSTTMFSFAGTANGEQYVDFGGLAIKEAKFYADASLCNLGKDYSVAGFATPDGGMSLALFGLGLVGVEAFRRKLAK